MRRATRISAIGPSRPQRPPRSQRGLARCPLSSSALVWLATAGIFGCSLYAAYLAGKGQRVAGGGHTLSVGDSGSATTAVPARVEERGTHKGRSFRQLNAFSYERGDGTRGAWKTCRVYEEEKLVPHKKAGTTGHDEHLRFVRPRSGAKWELAMSEDQDAEWLGLHQWDHRYQYGSEEADRRVKEMGYCRVHMPSVPRTGSTWFRSMFETATSQPSFSMWQEGGTFKPHYTAFSSDDPCGASLDHMEGQLRSPKVFPCRDLKPPNATSPILYKSHTPFFPSFNKPSLMPDKTCMLVLLVRNPIDNQDAWMRYMSGKGQIMREYLPIWQGHLSHWIASAGDIPIYIFRYEDMLYRTEESLRRLLGVLPGGWNWSEESIAKAMRLFGSKKPFEQKCGAGITRSSLAEVEIVRKHYGSFLRHFGYKFINRS